MPLRSLYIAFCLLFSISLKATHVVGGELYYDYLGQDQYQITLKLYRDCTALTDFDAQAIIGVFDGDGAFLFTTQLNFPGAVQVPVVLESPCLSLPPDICIETTSYVGTILLAPSPNGYRFTYQRCCRTAIIDNLTAPSAVGITITTLIPPSTIPINSSPRFTELPPVALCLNAPLSFDHSATDPDGDSLVYELCTPLTGGDAANATPDPPAGPPYMPVTWAGGYSETYPIDAAPAIAIDPVTGLLTVTPTLQGEFNIGVRVKEYRDGIMLTETLRDFLFKVVACDAAVVADISPQTVSGPPGSSLFCSGLTMPFTNASFGAQTWSWDFGDPAVSNDTSSAENPSWTYTQPGTYVVSQIANPGTTCADTTWQTFQVYFPPEPFILEPEPLCGNGPLSLAAQGVFGTAASLLWQFGPGISPPTSADSLVTVSFDGPGTHAVSLTVTENGCEATSMATITNHALPVADFVVDPASPQQAGTSVDLTDQSNANGGTITGWHWTLGGSTLGPSAPSITWNTDWPGSYTLTLEITTAEGCTDQMSMPYVVLGGEIVIPNVFSPNGDSSNDTFEIANVQYYHNDLTIYSRWGNKIYEVNNYKNQWDGSGVPEGTYYYVLHMGDGREYTGHLTIVR